MVGSDLVTSCAFLAPFGMVAWVRSTSTARGSQWSADAHLVGRLWRLGDQECAQDAAPVQSWSWELVGYSETPTPRRRSAITRPDVSELSERIVPSSWIGDARVALFCGQIERISNGKGEARMAGRNCVHSRLSASSGPFRSPSCQLWLDRHPRSSGWHSTTSAMSQAWLQVMACESRSVSRAACESGAAVAATLS